MNRVNLPSEGYIVFFDIETDGFVRGDVYPNILQISGVKYDLSKKAIVEEFDKYIYTREQITSKITQITGIDNKLLDEKGLDFKDVIKSFVEFIGDRRTIICGHNIDSFDSPILNYYTKNFFGRNYKSIDSLKQIRSITNGMYPSYKLGEIYQQVVGKSDKVFHNSLEDSKALCEIYEKLNI